MVLSPDLVKAAIEGRLPHRMGLTRLCELPVEWSRQYRVLGLTPQNPLIRTESPPARSPFPRKPNFGRGGTFPMYENRPGAVLTKDQAREIAGSAERAKDVAARFGVTEAVVYQIWRGDTWSNVTNNIPRMTYRKGACRKRTGPRKLSEEQVTDIFTSSDSPRSLARRFNVSKQLIWAIKSGRIWKQITCR